MKENKAIKEKEKKKSISESVKIIYVAVDVIMLLFLVFITYVFSIKLIISTIIYTSFILLQTIFFYMSKFYKKQEEDSFLSSLSKIAKMGSYNKAEESAKAFFLKKYGISENVKTFYEGIKPFKIEGTDRYSLVWGWHFREIKENNFYVFGVNIENFEIKDCALIDKKMNLSEYSNFLRSLARGEVEIERKKIIRDPLSGQIIEESYKPIVSKVINKMNETKKEAM